MKQLNNSCLMGAAASLSTDAPISLDKAKELAGELWSPSLEATFAKEWETKEGLMLSDLRRLCPTLFVQNDDNIELEKVKELTFNGGAGTDWNDVFQGLFDEHKETVSMEGDESTSLEVITFGKWKKLVPSLFETQEEKQVRMAAEFQAMLARRAEGNIVLNYQMYNEEFPISKNSITAARIDEDYGLTDVMPGCRIRLSTLDSHRRTLYENENNGRPAPWVKEEPEDGIFQELLAGETYYCLVIENPEQYKKDMADLAKKLETESTETEPKPRQEGCSCLYGNPCQDPYVCLDWDNRWKVSLANGMTQQEIQRAGII